MQSFWNQRKCTERKNIIIHGIRESQETEAIDRKREDTNIVVELCEFVNVDAWFIKNVVRLSKRNNGDKNTAEENTDKSRPVKVTLSDIEGKQMLMKNLSKLKHSLEHSLFKKMSGTHDMTKSEREQNKLKVVEAKTLNDNDTLGKDRCIVRGPPCERKVVKVKIKANKT